MTRSVASATTAREAQVWAVPFYRPAIGPKEANRVTQVLESGFVAYGDVSRAFEDQLCARVGAEAGVAVASGTVALALALESVGVRRADTVVTTGVGCEATISAIQRLGARARFVDVDWSSQTMAPGSLQFALAGGDVSAVLVVQFAGNTGQIRDLAAIAEQRGVPMVVDACHHLGHSDDEAPTNTSAENQQLTVFSFSATKVITTGEGGMVVGPSALIADIRSRALGRTARDGGVTNGARPGLKVVMSDITAAIGCTQLESLGAVVDQRQALALRYDTALSDCSQLQPMPRDPGSNIHYYLAAAKNRDAASRRLHLSGVQAIQLQGSELLRNPANVDVSREVLDRALALPLYPALSQGQIETVESALRDMEGSS